MTETKDSRSLLSRVKGKFSNTTKPVVILTSRDETFQATQWAVPTRSCGTAPSCWASISSTLLVSSSSPSVGVSTGKSLTPSTPLGRLSMWSVSSRYFLNILDGCYSSDSASVLLRSADCSDRRQFHLRERPGCPQSSHQVGLVQLKSNLDNLDIDNRKLVLPGKTIQCIFN